MQQAQTTVAELSTEEQPGPSGQMTRYRWKICALLFSSCNNAELYGSASTGAAEDRFGRSPDRHWANGGRVCGDRLGRQRRYAIGLLVAGRLSTGWYPDRLCCSASFWTLASISHYFAGMHAVAGALHESMAMLGRLLQHVPGVGSGHWVAQMENLAGAVIGLAIAALL